MQSGATHLNHEIISLCVSSRQHAIRSDPASRVEDVLYIYVIRVYYIRIANFLRIYVQTLSLTEMRTSARAQFACKTSQFTCGWCVGLYMNWTHLAGFLTIWEWPETIWPLITQRRERARAKSAVIQNTQTKQYIYKSRNLIENAHDYSPLCWRNITDFGKLYIFIVCLLTHFELEP